MRPVLRAASMIGFVLVCAVVVGLIIYGDDIRRMPKIGAGFYAKEFCSCYFVNGQSEDFCRDLVHQYVPLTQLKIDSEHRTVQAESLGAVRSARWVSERFGCVLNRP